MVVELVELMKQRCIAVILAFSVLLVALIVQPFLLLGSLAESDRIFLQFASGLAVVCAGSFVAGVHYGINRVPLRNIKTEKTGVP